MNNSKLNIFNNFLFKKTSFLASSSLVFILIFGIFSISKTTQNFLREITNIFHYQITSPEIKNPRLIVQQIQAVSELTTTKFIMDAIVPTSSSRKLGNFTIGETNLLYVARGEVKAGLDLSKIEEKDIRIEEGSIKITLPPPQILDEKIDVNKSQVYDYDRGFLNLGPDVANELQSEAQRQTLVKIRETACMENILDQANEKAVILIRQLMTTAGYEEIEINTTSGDNCQEKK